MARPHFQVPICKSFPIVRFRDFYIFLLGYLEISHSNQWGYVCDGGSWTMEEAKLVCKELGFPRGVRSTTQGLVHGSVNEKRKITENVECDGDENSLKKCRIR